MSTGIANTKSTSGLGLASGLNQGQSKHAYVYHDSRKPLIRPMRFFHGFSRKIQSLGILSSMADATVNPTVQ